MVTVTVEEHDWRGNKYWHPLVLSDASPALSQTIVAPTSIEYARSYAPSAKTKKNVAATEISGQWSVQIVQKLTMSKILSHLTLSVKDF